MQETLTTCDRCGRTETGDTTKWAELWIPASMTHVDLCEQCGKALLGWVQTGPGSTTPVRVEHPHENPKPLPPRA